MENLKPSVGPQPPFKIIRGHDGYQIADASGVPFVFGMDGAGVTWLMKKLDPPLASLSPSPQVEGLVKFVESLVNANGPYPYINGTGVVFKAYEALAAYHTVTPTGEVKL